MPVPIKATISGSSAGTLLGYNHYTTPLEFWQNTIEQLEPGFNADHGYELPDPFKGNAATRFGSAFESSNIMITEEKLGCKIEHQEQVFRDTVGNTPLSCHVDGLTTDGRLYEGKTVNIRAFQSGWGEPGTDQVPRTYNLQCQHNMYLSGTSEAVVSALVFPESPDKWEEMGWEVILVDDGNYLIGRPSSDAIEFVNPFVWARALSEMGFHHLYYIPRNDALIETMLNKYDEWWTKYIIGRKAPEPMNTADINRLCPAPSGTIVLDNEDMIAELQEYKEIKKETGKGGNLAKTAETIKTNFLKELLTMKKVIDDESCNKWVVRDNQGNKLASYGKNKAGSWVFR